VAEEAQGSEAEVKRNDTKFGTEVRRRVLAALKIIARWAKEDQREEEAGCGSNGKHSGSAANRNAV
jgi:hypothetical protein